MDKFSVNGISRLDKYNNPELIGADSVTELTNMVLKGNKAYRRKGFTVYNNNTFKPLKLIDGGNILYGATDSGISKSTNGTGSWSSVGAISSHDIKHTAYNEKIICANGIDDNFYIKDGAMQSLVVERPDIEGMSHTVNKISAGSELENIFIHKCVSDGTNLYGSANGGTKIYKFDLDSNIIAVSEDIFDYTSSICLSYDKSKLYVLNLNGTVYTLREVSKTDLTISKTWNINITPANPITDIHFSANKIWFGAKGQYVLQTQTSFIWNADTPADEDVNFTPTDRSLTVEHNNGVSGTWADPGDYFIPDKMFADGLSDFSTTITVIFRIRASGAGYNTFIIQPSPPITARVSTGIAWISEAHTAFNPFNGATSDVIPFSIGAEDTDTQELKLYHDVSNGLTFLMHRLTEFYAFNSTLSTDRGLIYYAVNNFYAIVEYLYERRTDSSLILSSYFQKSSICYNSGRLYFMNYDTVGGVGYCPSIDPDLIQESNIVYGSYNALGSNAYYYMMVYETADGNTSPPSHIYIVYSTSIGDNSEIVFSNIPISSDSRTVKKKIYRSTYDGIALYRIAILDNTEDEYTDNTLDVDLDLSLQLEETINQFISNDLIQHNSRIFYAGVKGQQNSITTSLYAGDTSTTKFALDGTSGGSIANGTYNYKFAIIDEYGKKSPLSYAIPITLTGSNTAVNLIVNDPELRYDYTAVKYEIYRTKNGGSTYYYIATANIGTTYKDTKQDALLVTAYSEILNGSRLIWSEIETIGTISASSYVDVNPDDNDVIMGLADDVEGIIIFKQKGIYKLYTTGLPDGWTLRKISEANTDQNIILSYDNKHYFLKDNNIYRTDSIIAPLNLALGSELDAATIEGMVYYEKFNWLVINAVSALYVFDFVANSWYKFTISGITIDTIGIYNSELIISYNKLYYYNVSAVIDLVSTAINTILKSKVFTALKSTELYRLRKFLINYKKTDNINATFTITDIDTAGTLVYTDSVNSANPTDYVRRNIVIENMTGSVKISNKMDIKLENIEELDNMDLMFTTLHRNLR